MTLIQAAILCLATRAVSAQEVVTHLMPIAVEQRLADQANLAVGDTVRVTVDRTQAQAIVTAIYAPAPDPATIMRRDLHIRFHLADLAELLGAPDRVDRIAVVLRPGIGVDSSAARLNRAAFGYHVVASAELASRSSTTFEVVSRFHRAIAIISVLASTIFLLCLMLLKIEERRRDVAVLRFTGISRRTIWISLVLEAAMVALVGSAVGVVIALIAGHVVNAHYQAAYHTALIFSEINPGTVLFACALSLLLGIVVGAIAAWRLLAIPPVDLWHRAA